MKKPFFNLPKDLIETLRTTRTPFQKKVRVTHGCHVLFDRNSAWRAYSIATFLIFAGNPHAKSLRNIDQTKENSLLHSLFEDEETNNYL